MGSRLGAAMRPFTVHATISAPREEIFDYVVDLAGRVAYCDHYMRDYRLARANTQGPGAAARFKLSVPFGSQWAEIELAECDRPRRIAERSRFGRLGRNEAAAIYEFVAQSSSTTRVELTVWTEPSTPLDRMREKLGSRRWLRRQSAKSLERLRRLFEEASEDPRPRTTIAGYEPLKAPRFGA